MLTPKKAGYATITDARGVKEFDTLTCAHCNRVFVVRSGNPQVKAEIGGGCRICMKHICSKCVDKRVCTPFERQLERMEAKEKLYRDIGI